MHTASQPATGANIAAHLPAAAALHPERPAIRVPRARGLNGAIDYLTLSLAELEEETNAWALHACQAGVGAGDRVLVMVRQGLPLIAATFALFKIGAVPVLIDPGMGLRNLLSCVRSARPRVLLGIPLAHTVSRLFPRSFQSVRVRIAASSRATFRLAEDDRQVEPFTAQAAGPGDLAAVLFTSGSTGAPKGVLYQHGMFAAQVRLIRATYGIDPGEIDLPMLPIFALFNPALGMTTIVPELNPSRPARVQPEKIVRAILQEQVTNSFGSPVLWRKIARHCLERRITLPSLRRILMAGAPVPPALMEDLGRVAVNAELHSPYGATEALPVSSISAGEVLAETATLTYEGKGTCVGRPVAEVRVKIIALRETAVSDLAVAGELPGGQVGEIAVSGPVVTRAYDDAAFGPQSGNFTKLAKIPDGSDVWHRMGDAGYLDPEGKIWFCGRAAERVTTAAGTLFTECCEPIFNRHPRVHRTALIGLGRPGEQVPALAVEPLAGSFPRSRAAREAFARELRELGRRHPDTAEIRHFFFRRAFPVDVRHNAKIHRLRLARDLTPARAVVTD